MINPDANFLTCFRHKPSEVELLFQLLLVFTIRHVPDFHFLRKFLDETVAKVFDWAPCFQCHFLPAPPGHGPGLGSIPGVDVVMLSLCQPFFSLIGFSIFPLLVENQPLPFLDTRSFSNKDCNTEERGHFQIHILCNCE